MTTVLPAPIRTLFSRFPLSTYPPIHSPYHAERVQTPTLWIHPPRSSSNSSGSDEKQNDLDVLSSDVECLKWQAYLALRLSYSPQPAKVAVRWDVSPSGAVDGRLPNLHAPLDTLPQTLIAPSEGKEKKVQDDGEGEVLPARHIPEWVSGRLGEELGDLEGYRDVEARDESRAWVSLLEGNVHAALVSLVVSTPRRLS
jgi:metaxin